MKLIPLTRGLFAQVDDEDYDYLMQWKWYALKNKNTFYAQRTITIKGKDLAEKMHRVIMKTSKEMEVDHMDHNGLNNQKTNLRNCTHVQNSQGRIMRKHSSIYKGVLVYKGKIFARITAYGTRINLGVCETEEQSARRYNAAAQYFHGEFAHLNQI